MVVRDTDMLVDIKEHSPVSVGFSITCAGDETCKVVEPNASTTTERFKAIEHLAKSGIITGVFMDPVIPYITDTKENVQEMVKKAKYYGAKYMYMSPQVAIVVILVLLFICVGNSGVMFFGLLVKIFTLPVRHCRSPQGKKLWNIFAEICEKEGMCYSMRVANQMIRHGYDV